MIDILIFVLGAWLGMFIGHRVGLTFGYQLGRESVYEMSDKERQEYFAKMAECYKEHYEHGP